LHELFENIIPYYNIPGQYVYYPPLIRPNRAQHSWRTIFSKSVLNRYYGGRLNTDVDNVIGEAIWNRIRRHTGIQDPYPYQFQIEAIVSGLNVLDMIRSALRSGNIRAVQSFDPNPSTIAVLAPTGGGKTEVFEVLTLQLVLDSHRGNLGLFTKAIIIYPMKAFMIEHFRRFVEDITYINTQLNTNISIGVLDGDTPNTLSTPRNVLRRLSYLLGSQRCPLCGAPLRVRGHVPYYIIECSGSPPHRLNIRIARDMIFHHPPDILLTTIDSFNYVLLERNRHVLLGAPSRYTSPNRLPPIILALDEPHVYTGVFGSNTSLILRDFEYVVQEYARRQGIQQYKPLKIVTSATMPYASEFLARLFVEEPRRIRIITSNYQAGRQRNKGFIMFLPLREIHRFGFENAIIEIVPLIAAILPRNYRKILVFVDSVEFAERLRRYMEDYIQRGLPDYSACAHLFQPDVCDPSTRRFNPNAIRVAVHTSFIPTEQREHIEEGIRRTPPEYNIVIATPTLELGIDIGDITVVVIAGLPPTPEKFAQRAGRAGRRNPGLVVVIGNDTSTVDRYYLSDYNRAITYLQSSLGAAPQQTYMLPLNPMNLESIRRFLGNFMATYANIRNIPRMSLIQGHNTRILQDYLSLAIDRVTSSFSSSNSALLQNIASFASNIRTNLARELMQLFQDIIRVFGSNTVSSFVAPGYAKRQYFEGRVDFVPIIDNVRSSMRPIEVRYYTNVQPPSAQQRSRLAFSREIDALRALTYYAVRFVDAVNGPFHDYILRLQDVQRRINLGKVSGYIHSLRGTLHYSSYSGDSYLFEVAGLFYSQLDALNNYGMLRRALEEFRRNIEIVRNISLEFDRRLSSTLKSHGRYRMTLRRIYNLIDAIEEFLRVSSQRSPHIIEPLTFYLLTPGILGVDHSNIIHDMLRSRGRDLIPLDYFGVIQQVKPKYGKAITYWEFIKIPVIKCPNCKGDIIELVTFNRTSLSLRLRCLRCKKVFDFGGKSPQWFVDMIRTRPVTYAVVVKRDPTIRRRLPNSPFELIFYRDTDAVFGNVGFRIFSTNNKRASRFMRTLSLTSNEQYILGFRFKTQALELKINWRALSSLMNSRLMQRIGNEYRSLGIAIPQNFNIQNDFIIRVTHTLSHLLINFAPIHTGGNRWDVNEYISFETDGQGDIIASSIIVFDSDEGGNGVSELIGYFIREILSDALSEAARYYLQQRDALIRFLGEPGITFFSTWPICPYDNIALSRSLTLLFIQHLLGLSGIQQLTNLTPQQLSPYIPVL